MFGSNYFRHPELLAQSLVSMNPEYEKTARTPSGLLSVLRKGYIRLLGIPEVGFQVRGMYFRRAIGYFSDFHPMSILDVGSGIGLYAFYLAGRFPRARVTGWEIDKAKLAVSKKLIREFKAQHVKFMYGDIVAKFPRGMYFDFILTIDVLEHIQEYKKALTNIYSHLTAGGYLYIHVPQIRQKRFFSSFRNWEHEDHVREGFDPGALSRDLTKIGFTIISLHHTFGFFGSLAWELNHLCLRKSAVLAAMTYPFVYMLACLDLIVPNRQGLGVAILAQKKRL